MANSQPIKTIFLGTPSFAVPSLEALLSQKENPAVEVAAVVTRPDAKRGRGNALTPSPVKEAALKAGVPVFEENRMTPDLEAILAALKPDLAVVAAFGALLPTAFLEIPKKGTINVHASLLPRWRGAAPIERAILAGDETTGISIMRVEEGLDSGPYALQGEVSIVEKTAGELTDELADLGARLLVETVAAIADDTVRWIEQDETKVTLAPKIEKEEMHLSPSKTRDENLRIVQASSSKAPARLKLSNGKNVRIVSAREPLTGQNFPQAHLEPFEVLADKTGLFFGANEGAFEALEVIPEGKKKISGVDFARGLQNVKDLRWGS